jgi:DNA-binding CsgD family transcriptional regulator
MACATVALKSLGHKAWHKAVGEAAQQIGSPDFERVLLGLFGRAVSHDAVILAHYSANAPVDVIYFQGLSHPVVDLFRREFYHMDPFTIWWRDKGRPGVVPQSMIVPNRRHDPYSSLFQRKAGISDEMAMFLPPIAGMCAGLFLERRRGRFTSDEIATAETIYPAVEGLYLAHCRIAPAREQGNTSPIVAKTRPLPDISDALSQREREIVELVLLGFPNVQIARKLSISPGTVRNHRLNIYRKLDITSERELFLRYVDLLSNLNT